MKKFIVLLFLALIVFVIVESRKKTKKNNKKAEVPEDPLNRRPDGISKELYCDACQAMIKEGTKELRGKKSESEVFDMLDNVCDPEKYNVYRMFIF